MIAAARLVLQAREWVGVPFLHQGRTRHGCDCLGFIAGCLGELDAPMALELLPIDYGREPQEQLVANLTKLCKPLQLQAGALLLIQWPKATFPSHAAIYTGESMVHAYEAVGKVVEHGYRAPWLPRTASIWAIPDVSYE